MANPAVGWRKLTEDPATPDYVGHVIFTERINNTSELKHTTLIVKDKTFDQGYKARQFIEQRMGEIFAAAPAATSMV